jgi:nodulation protein E
MQRVVVTGHGVISVLGHDVADFLQSLQACALGIDDLRDVSTESIHTRAAAQVKDIDIDSHFDRSQLSMLDRASRFAMYAARQAVQEAGLDFRGELGARAAVIVSTGAGCATSTENSYGIYYADKSRWQHPLTVPKAMLNK